jgi:hypothetical protein
MHPIRNHCGVARVEPHRNLSRSMLIAFACRGIAGCECGTSTGPAPIRFTTSAPPSGGGFAAQYAPPADVGPRPNDICNLPGPTLSVPVKLTRPAAAVVQ